MTLDEVMTLAADWAGSCLNRKLRQSSMAIVLREAIQAYVAEQVAAEQEACIDDCKRVGQPVVDDPNSVLGEYYRADIVEECIDAIRARGTAESNTTPDNDAINPHRYCPTCEKCETCGECECEGAPRSPAQDADEEQDFLVWLSRQKARREDVEPVSDEADSPPISPTPDTQPHEESDA